MCENDDRNHAISSLFVSAELRAALIQADLHERKLHLHVTTWPTDIGFVICPLNSHLAELREEEKVSDLHRQQHRIADLTADLRKMFAGWRPASVDLEDAPIITPDAVIHVPGLEGHSVNLVGHVRNVPGGGPDRRRITSTVAAFDAQRFSWVRTLSRFYRVEPGTQYVSRN